MNARKRLLIGLPTLQRSDLLTRNWLAFCDRLQVGDEFLVLDNGNQSIDLPPRCEIHRSSHNLGVPGSWNYLAEVAWQRDFEALILVQDDICWNALESARELLDQHPKVNLFLSHLEFSVQVLRRTTYQVAGPYDVRFSPCFFEDDDYALTLTKCGLVYERFDALNPERKSSTRGTSESVSPQGWAHGSINHQKLLAKWGAGAAGFHVNHRRRPYYQSNRGMTLAQMLGHEHEPSIS